MIEILILYTIRKREKTIYAIRKEIIEIFGAFTKPSIGTIYPALKRLQKMNAVVLQDKMSEGGRKSSYYSLSRSGMDYLKELFFVSSDNPSLFYGHLQAKLAVMGVLDADDKKKFINECQKQIELYKFELQDKLNNEFIELDYYQTQLFKRTLKEIADLESYIGDLEIK